MALDDDLNRMLNRLRIMESAMHGKHVWALDFTGCRSGLPIQSTQVARVVVGDTGVTFVATLTLSMHAHWVSLLRDGEVVFTQQDNSDLVLGGLFALGFGMETTPVSV